MKFEIGDYIIARGVLIKVAYIYQNVHQYDGYSLLNNQYDGGHWTQCRPAKQEDFNKVFQAWLTL